MAPINSKNGKADFGVYVENKNTFNGFDSLF
jgi:hypothetical protein